MMTVGVDVAKGTLEVAVWHAGHAVRLGTFAQTMDGWVALRDALTSRQIAGPVIAGARQVDGGPMVEAVEAAEAAGEEPVDIVLEPTGGYELAFALWARQQPGWRVHRPNPAHVRAWARSQGGRAKTDRQDALLLARFGASAQPALPVWQPVASEVSELDQLLRRRDEVKDWLERERRRQEQLGVRPEASTTVRASVERLLTTLQEELADLERAIAEQVQRHATLRACEQRLRTVPGVGPRVALPLLVACERYHTLAGEHGTAKGVVAYVGLDPQPHESGTSVRQRSRISRQGDRSLRARLYMGALGALRGNNPVRTFYERLVARGKPKKLALIAAARKLLTWAWAVFISGEPFDATKTLKLVA
jgi:transposase